MVPIYEKMKNNYYNNTKTQMPWKPDYTKTIMCECCNEFRTIFDKEKYDTDNLKHREEKNALFEEFKRDCFEFYDIENHPCRHLIFSKAWDDGHSSGYQEVHNCMRNVIEFVKKIEEVLKHV